MMAQTKKKTKRNMMKQSSWPKCKVNKNKYKENQFQLKYMVHLTKRVMLNLESFQNQKNKKRKLDLN